MKLGDWGEETASRYLNEKGYRILERNFSCRLGELDIIALDRDELVFVEVKTRKDQSYGLPCEAVNAAKIRHLKRMAAYYTTVFSAEQRDARLDVIEILTRNGRAYIRHIKNITG